MAEPTCIYGARYRELLASWVGERFGEDGGWSLEAGPMVPGLQRVCALFVLEEGRGIVRVGVLKQRDRGVDGDLYVSPACCWGSGKLSRQLVATDPDLIRVALESIESMRLWEKPLGSQNVGSVVGGVAYCHLVISRAMCGVLSSPPLEYEENNAFMDLFERYDEAVFGREYSDMIAYWREHEKGLSPERRAMIGKAINDHNRGPCPGPATSGGPERDTEP